MMGKMKDSMVKYRRVFVIFLQMLLVAFSFVLAFVSRYDSTFYASEPQYDLFLQAIVPLMAIRLATSWYFGLFKGLWKYVSVNDLKAILKATFIGTALFAIYVVAANIEGFPRSIYLIDLACNILFAGGIRLAVRFYRERTEKARLSGDNEHRNTLIIGAGDAGEMMLRELNKNRQLGYNVVGFIDDDRTKRRLSIHGVPILGNTRDIPKIVAREDIREIILALPSASGRAVKRIVNVCKSANVRFKILPYISDLIDGKISVSQIRDVAIEDLLGREAVSLDMSLIGAELSGRVVMVTGAAGSIGSELVRQVARFSPRKIILFERSENDLYHLEQELSKQPYAQSLVSFVGDVCDGARVAECMRLYRPTHVFHAAAYKHVPMMELNPTEAVRNNVFGTRTLARTAIAFGVEKFVFISTDKAVRPANVMGATKRVAELVLQSLAGNGTTHFIAVRFGNVLGSNGSVIPLFKKQIADGGPVTVTHKEITRYFMTIPEAVQLVLQAGAMGSGGELFILEMGNPVKIVDLAENLIRLSGLKPGEDIEIRYTGLRPGEKLYEELLIDGEDVKRTHHEKIWVLDSVALDAASFDSKLATLELACKKFKAGEIKTVLRSLVPEYVTPPYAENLTLVVSAERPVAAN